MTATGGITGAVIDGIRVGGGGDVTSDVIDPATGERVARVVRAGRDMVDAAVSSARRVQRSWREWAPTRRGAALAAWAEKIHADAVDLARLESAATGRPLRGVLAEIRAAAAEVGHWAGRSDKFFGQQRPGRPGHLAYTRRDPVGVVGVILSWRGQVAAFADQTAAALACGNAVVVKPSGYAPLAALRLADLAVAAGLPAGLVNVVPGPAATGELLATHPHVGGVRVSGGTAAGRRISAALGARSRTVLLDPGGASTNVVFADAELDVAAAAAAHGVFRDPGGRHHGGTRVLVQRRVAAEFADRLTELAEATRLGDPRSDDTDLGPLPSRLHLERLLDYRRMAAVDGVSSAVGEQPWPAEAGCFASPMVFVGVEPALPTAGREVCGPALAVLPFDDEEQLLAVVDAAGPIRSATVWTGGMGRMFRLVERLPAESVWGNTPPPGGPDGGDPGASEAAVAGLIRSRHVMIRYAAR